MVASLFQQLTGGALLRIRMEARKAAFAIAAGLMVLAAAVLAGAAGIVVFAARYGVIAGLLAGAAFMLLLAGLTILIGRRVPGADASRSQVQAEAILEQVPAPGVPSPETRSSLASLTSAHEAVRTGIGDWLPPGSEVAVSALAARQLARRPAATLGTAVVVGAALGLYRMRYGVASRSQETGEAEAEPQRADDPVDRNWIQRRWPSRFR